VTQVTLSEIPMFFTGNFNKINYCADTIKKRFNREVRKEFMQRMQRKEFELNFCANAGALAQEGDANTGALAQKSDANPENW